MVAVLSLQLCFPAWVGPLVCDSPPFLGAATRLLPADSGTAPDVRAQFSAPQIVGQFLLPKNLEHAGGGKIRLSLCPPANTSARCLNRLAATLRPGCGRRCQLARPAGPAASGLDFLQGASEKIHLQGLLGNQTLQLAHLSSKSRFAGLLRYWFVF